MKCLSCQKVVQTHALEEKILNGTVLCYCSNPNFVEAVASSSNPTIQLGNNRRQAHQPPVTSNNSRLQLNWRDTGSNNTQIPSTNSISNSRAGISGSSNSRSTIPSTSSSNSGFWVVALLVFFGVGNILGSTPFGKQLANQIQNTVNSKQNTSKSNSIQNTNGWNFPLPQCGDDNPSNQQNFYPVFVNTTNQNTLNHLQKNYCNDAFIVYRKLAKHQSIQVASFLSKSKADKFVKILNKDSKVGNAEVGVP